MPSTTTDTPPSSSDPTERRRVGRPSKLNRQMIAEAAHEIGLSGLTLKAVADHLGVSVPGLYHHIDGKEDLMRVAAEYSAGRIELPVDEGQHWAVWLYEWAHYNRDAFVSQPELLKQFIEGAIAADRTAVTYETVLRRLAAEGFSPSAAQLAYSMISEYAVGAAVFSIRASRAAENGRPMLAELQRILAAAQADEYPNLRGMVAERTTRADDSFNEGLLRILRGICTDREERWPEVEARVRDLIESG